MMTYDEQSKKWRSSTTSAQLRGRRILTDLIINPFKDKVVEGSKKINRGLCGRNFFGSFSFLGSRVRKMIKK